jgi:DNA processing protein
VDVNAIRTVARREPGYPPLLSELHDPPATLFVRGDADALPEAAVAVVGARSCSAYGAQVARTLARELASAGLVVVSGLARGVDGEAHRGALDGGGRTVAVLGCGIDRDYPRSHAELARRIIASGAVVSEYPPGVEPAPWRFPARKRKRVGAVRVWLNHAVRPCRLGREMPCPCGPGVVSEVRLGGLISLLRRVGEIDPGGVDSAPS